MAHVSSAFGVGRSALTSHFEAATKRLLSEANDIIMLDQIGPLSMAARLNHLSAGPAAILPHCGLRREKVNSRGDQVVTPFKTPVVFRRKLIILLSQLQPLLNLTLV